jgi:type VI secretion system secreted protein VgrG
MKRLINAQTPLGDDLMFSALTGREEMSRLFDFSLELKSVKSSIPVKALLGQSITVEMQLQDGAKRYLNAQCSQFHATGKTGRYYVYEARLRPWLWYASRRSDFKIFQQMTVPEIVLDVLGKTYPFPVDNRLTANYRKWDYNVQYRETDFNFVSRLMEHEGIYYYFEHTAGEHTLVLCDGLNAHSPFPGYASVPYYPPDSAYPGEDYFDTWTVGQALDSGAFRTDDYDFIKPSAELVTSRDKPRPHPHADYEIYDFPGGYTETDDGERYSRMRMEELQADHETIQGFGEVRGAAPGRLFTLKRHPRADQNRDYLITSAHYTLRDNSYEADADAGMLTWRVHIDAIPASETYRPQRLTPKPHSMGPETAVVVGPEGEEIHTDEYGRVKVQFHWDRYGKKNDQSSCWIRVAHPWAGTKWGFIHIPRMGQEVMVDFLGGDPDYPIITGSVYNAEQMPPYGLPQNKTASGFKSRSSKGAEATDYNELRFEDLKGEEQIYLHAQRNLDTVVELDESHVVGRDRQNRVERNDQRYVNNNDTQAVTVDQTMTVGGNQVLSVGGNREISVSGKQSAAVAGNHDVDVGGNASVHVSGDQEVSTEGSHATSVTGDARYMFQSNLNNLVFGDRKCVINGNDIRSVVGNASYMASDYAMTAVKDYSLTIGVNRATKITGTDSSTIALSQTNDIGVSQTNSIGASQTTTVGASQSLSVGGSQTVTVGGAASMQAAATYTLSAGGVLSISAGGAVTISGSAVTINAAAIALNAAAVTISGVLTVPTVIATAIVSTSYTPGAGNLF